jgi:O-methyltransferase
MGDFIRNSNTFLRRLSVQTWVDCGTLVARPPGSEQVLRLAGTARRIWELLEYPTHLDEIVAGLHAEFSGGKDEIRADAESCIAFMHRRGAVETCPAPTTMERQRCRYLHLLKRALVNLIYPEHELRIKHLRGRGAAPNSPDTERLEKTRLLRDIRYRQPERYEALLDAKQDCTSGAAGGDPFCFPHTLVGLSGLDSLERCAERVFAAGIPGDFLEAGVCQGGAAIFLRALQIAFGEGHRRVWAADSFEGLAQAQAEPDLAGGIDFTEPKSPQLAFNLQGVMDNFRRYELLDEGVVFLPGWFAETLSREPIGPLAILRIDADMYSSTREVLENLYHLVVPGGFVIVDDYGFFPFCRQAVDEFRSARNIREPLGYADRTVVYWRKEENPGDGYI